VRGWHKPFPTAGFEEMSAEGGRRLYVQVSRPGAGFQTDPGGVLKRENGWIYGGGDNQRWSVPESAVVGITEA